MAWVYQITCDYSGRSSYCRSPRLTKLKFGTPQLYAVGRWRMGRVAATTKTCDALLSGAAVKESSRASSRDTTGFANMMPA